MISLYFFFNSSKPRKRIESSALEKITMTLEQQTFPSETKIIVATITNNTKYEIITDLHFSIEYFDGKRWIELPMSDNFAFSDIAIIVHPLESKDFDIHLEAFPLKYSGLYRIHKNINLNNKYYSDTDHELTVEFHLK